MKKTLNVLSAVSRVAIIAMFAVIGLSFVSCGGDGDNSGGGSGTGAVTGVSLNRTTLALTVGGMETLTATVSPTNAVNKAVSWSSSAPSIAMVMDGGVVYGVSVGSATITVTTVDSGKTATCAVTVSNDSGNNFSVTSVTLDKTSISLTAGSTETLTPTILPSTAIIKSVTWSSSDTSVARVSSSGVVTALAAGSATITVTTVDGGKTATCAVTVREGQVYTFNSADDFGRWLSSQPTNSFAASYNVKLNVSSTAGLKEILKGEPKYVSLDLSGCTMTTIPNEAFYECTRLTRVIIPNSVTTIGERAFAAYFYMSGYANNLSSVTLGSSVTSIGKEAFKYCYYLASITIPNSVTSIGESAFSTCNSLASVTIGNGVTNIGRRAFEECRSLTSLVIPNSVTSIGEGAFYYCNMIENLTIGNKVTSIGGNAFANCINITSITIPSSVTSIGGNAFLGSMGTSIRSVTFQGTIPSSGFSTSSAFHGDLRAKFYATDASNGTPGTYTRASGATLWYRQ